MNTKATPSKPDRKKITKRVVDGAKPAANRDRFIWDTEIKGFGLRIKPSGAKSYFYRYRNKKSRKAQIRVFTIGRHPDITADRARSKAKVYAGKVADGIDIVAEEKRKKEAGTVAKLGDTFLKEYVDNPKLAKPKKKNTRREHRRAIEKHIVPALGDLTPDEITIDHVEDLHGSLADTPYLANRVLAVLSKMINWAIKKRYRTDATNPCKFVDKNPEPAHDRRLDHEELHRLGEALVDLEQHGPERKGRGNKPIERSADQARFDQDAAAAIRLLLFTGCRLNEILTLRWKNVDLKKGMLNLPETKTGPRDVVLSAPAMEVLSGLKERGEFVFPGKLPGQGRSDALRRPWDWVREQAKLEGVRLHTLRHTFASFGGDANISTPMLQKLTGHKQASTLQRYIKLDKDPVRRAADRVAGDIAAGLNGESGEVVPFEKV